MASGIILAQYAGSSILADDDGICRGQSATASAKTLTINGSLTSGGVWTNPGWGYKVKVVSAGNDTGKTITVAGKFYASNSVGGYVESIQIALGNATSVTSSLYATEITSVVAATITASSITLGLAADGSAVPVGLNHGALYQITYGGTFAGSTAQIKKYHSLTDEWIAVGSAATSAMVENVHLPAGSAVKCFVTTGSTTSSLGIMAEQLQQR